MVNPKTPNKKRKSFANADGGGQSPKVAKLDTSIKTPGKGKGNATPGRFNKSPRNQTPQNRAKTPNSNRGPRQTPFKNQQQGFGNKNRNKRASESEGEGSPPKKLNMFTGTSELKPQDQKKPQGQGAKVQASKQDERKKNEKEAKKVKRKGQFFHLKEKINGGDKAALEELTKKIEGYQQKKDLTKTAKRKLKMLLKLKSVATGEKVAAKPTTPSVSKQRRDRKQNAKSRKVGEGGQDKPAAQKKGAIKKAEEEDDDESDDEIEVNPDKILKLSGVEEEESDDGEEEEESGEEEEVSGEEEEGSGEEEEDSDDDEVEGESDEDKDEEDSVEEEETAQIPQKGKKTTSTENTNPSVQDLKESNIIDSKKTRYIVFVGNLPYDATRQEISEHFIKAGEVRHIRIPTDRQTNKPRGFAYVEFDDEVTYQKALSMHHTFIKGRRINCLYTQGGNKKGEEKKNEMKAKNFKLQAMRKQGQLAGSVKENQKRAARRGKKNFAKAVNGASS